MREDDNNNDFKNRFGALNAPARSRQLSRSLCMKKERKKLSERLRWFRSVQQVEAAALLCRCAFPLVGSTKSPNCPKWPVRQLEAPSERADFLCAGRVPPSRQPERAAPAVPQHRCGPQTLVTRPSFPDNSIKNSISIGDPLGSYVMGLDPRQLTSQGTRLAFNKCCPTKAP